MSELAHHLAATILPPDDGLPVRLAVLALAAIFLWRFLYLIAQAPRPCASGE